MSFVAVTVSTPTAEQPAVSPPRRTAGHRWLSRTARLHAVGLVSFISAGFLGRLTLIEDSGLALLWPAGGVAATWLFFSPRSQRGVLLVVLGAAAFLFNVTTGATPGVSSAFAVSNLLQVLVFLLLLERLCPDLWGLSGRLPLAGVRTLTCVTGAAAAGALVGVLAGQVGMALVRGGPQVEVAGVWVGRNFAGILAVFAIVHLMAYRFAGEERAVHVPRWHWVAMVTVTVAVYAPAFGQRTLPLAFMAMVAVLWVGLRSDAVVGAAHAVLGGTIAVVLTLLDRGPFHLVPDLLTRALVVQLFLVVVLVAVLYLSAAREEQALVAQDLARERAHAAAQAELVESAFAHVSDALLVVGEDGSILDANPSARRVLDMLFDKVPGRVGELAVRRRDGAEVPRDQTPAIRALRGEVVEREEVVVTDRHGRRHAFSVDATPLRGPGAARVVVTFRDVTEESDKLDQLAAFAKVVAHDLRGPLTALQGWADVARQSAEPGTPVGPGLVTALDRIRTSSARLAALVEDLLLHATADERTIREDTVDVQGLLADITTTRGLEGTLEVGVIPQVRGDVVLLRHLMDNLVGNAVKYVAPGTEPHVAVHGLREGDHVLISVCDNGVGVPQTQREKIFDRFERLPGTGVDGTGLGLSICRTIAERHGGRIDVDDGPRGEGSCFTVTLPAA